MKLCVSLGCPVFNNYEDCICRAQVVWYVRGFKLHLCTCHCSVLYSGSGDQVDWREERVGSPYLGTFWIYFWSVIYLRNLSLYLGISFSLSFSPFPSSFFPLPPLPLYPSQDFALLVFFVCLFVFWFLVGLDFELGFMLAKQAGALPLELHYQSAYIYFLNKRHLF
jgi:hypothetical protein